MRNISVKLFQIWTSGSGGDVLYKNQILAPQWSGTTYAILVADIMGIICVKLF